MAAGGKNAEAVTSAPEGLKPNTMSASAAPENTPSFSGAEQQSCEIQEMTVAEAAGWYARNGFPVFPLHSIIEDRCSCGKPDCSDEGKHPQTLHGFKDATANLVEVASYWQHSPNANIGLRTGAISGLVALDVDPRHGGDDLLTALILKHGSVLGTAQQTTGGGGKHIVFRFPAGIQLPSYLAPGIELKGDGRYIVVAPSLHKSGAVINGMAFRVSRACSPQPKSQPGFWT